MATGLPKAGWILGKTEIMKLELNIELMLDSLLDIVVRAKLVLLTACTRKLLTLPSCLSAETPRAGVVPLGRVAWSLGRTQCTAT